MAPRPLFHLGFVAGPVALAALAAASAGCDGEESFLLPPLDAGEPGPEYASVCSGWAERECAYEQQCGVSVEWQWTSTDQCVSRRALLCELEANDPDTAFDPQVVESCQFPTSCASALGTVPEPYAPTLCLPHGRAADGTACVWNDDCQSGECFYAYYIDGSMSTCGVCNPRVECNCQTGQECLFEDGGTLCVTLPSVGEACGPPYNACAVGDCIENAQGTAGTCINVPSAGLGEPCSFGQLGPTCDGPGAFCDSETMRCTTFLATTYGNQCAGQGAPEGAVCVGAGVCDNEVTGNCIPPSPDGNLCSSTQGLDCLPPAECIGNVCIFPTLAVCSP